MPKTRGSFYHDLPFEGIPEIPFPFDHENSFKHYLATSLRDVSDVPFPFPGAFKQFLKICLILTKKKPEDIKGIGFSFTDKNRKILIRNGIPENLLLKLEEKKLKGVLFAGERNFLRAIQKEIGEKETQKYKAVLLQHTKRDIWKRAAVVNFRSPNRPHPTNPDLVAELYRELNIKTLFGKDKNKLWFYLFANCNRDVDYIDERQQGSIPQISPDILHMATGLNKASPEQQEMCLRFVQTTLDKKNTPERQDEYPLEECVKETGFELSTLEKWVREIEQKGQAIFYGPPGTGKTFMAEKLAQHLIGGGRGFKRIVQFHPAYAYEDFIQGIRPKARKDGGLEYLMVPGHFRQFCQQAQKTPDDTCVLIIDEINRANLARVFGELMYLLEYRGQDHEIPLAGGDTLFIPKNVRIIGTMNTADRSIKDVDHALYRRFGRVPFYPDYEALRRYHERNNTGFAIERLISILEQLNAEIGDWHYYVGISFFLHKNLSEVIADIWQMEIEPYLEELFFDQSAKVEKFCWKKIREKLLL